MLAFGADLELITLVLWQEYLSQRGVFSGFCLNQTQSFASKAEKLLKVSYKLLEGHTFVGDVQPLFVGDKFLLHGSLGNAIDIGQALVGETQADQHAELIVLLLKFGIGFFQSLREAVACDIKEG